MFQCIQPLWKLRARIPIRHSTTCMPKDPCDPGTNITIFDNGVRVATEFQQSPISSIGLFIEAGSRFETTYNNGMTNFLERMAYKGFVGLNRCQLEQSLLNMGVRMTAHTGREVQSFTAVFPSECVEYVVGYLTGVVTNLALDPCEIEMAKCNMYSEMADEDRDPRSVVFDYLHQTAFQGTPLAKSVIGPSANARCLSRQNVVSYLCQHYQPYKFCVATSGNIPHKTMECAIRKSLGTLSAESSHESEEGPLRFTGSQIVYRDDSMPFVHVAIALECPGYSSPDFWVYYVASFILGNWHRSQGGGEGNATYLARASSVAKISERFESFYIPYSDVGLWGVYFVSKRWDLEDMMELVQNQWLHLCFTSQNTDLERAINCAKMQLARDVIGVTNSCNDIGTQLLYWCTRKSLQQKYDMLSNITLIRMHNCMQKIIYDRCLAVAAVGPTETLPDYTRTRASQYWLRL